MKYVQFPNGRTMPYEVFLKRVREDDAAEYIAAKGLVVVDDEEQVLAEPTTVDEEPVEEVSFEEEEPEEKDSFLDESLDESEEEDEITYPEGGEF